MNAILLELGVAKNNVACLFEQFLLIKFQTT